MFSIFSGTKDESSKPRIINPAPTLPNPDNYNPLTVIQRFLSTQESKLEVISEKFRSMLGAVKNVPDRPISPMSSLRFLEKAETKTTKAAPSTDAKKQESVLEKQVEKNWIPTPNTVLQKQLLDETVALKPLHETFRERWAQLNKNENDAAITKACEVSINLASQLKGYVNRVAMVVRGSDDLEKMAINFFSLIRIAGFKQDELLLDRVLAWDIQETMDLDIALFLNKMLNDLARMGAAIQALVEARYSSVLPTETKHSTTPVPMMRRSSH